MASPPSPHKEERAILEAIRQGKAPTIVKRQASRGTLPVDAEEMVEILVFLTHDPDPTCSGTARKTNTSVPGRAAPRRAPSMDTTRAMTVIATASAPPATPNRRWRSVLLAATSVACATSSTIHELKRAPCTCSSGESSGLPKTPLK